MKYSKVVLLSGTGGPLGNAISRQNFIDRRFVGFRSSDCNLLDKEATKSYFLNFASSYPQVELAYIHAAAISGGSHFSDSAPATLFVENIEIAINALEACRSSGISRVILVLSTSCYSSLIDHPKESDLHKFPILTSEYGYAYAKRMLEVLMRAYNKQYDMNISCVLVNGIIGSAMNFDDSKSILPAALIKRFHSKRDDFDPIVLWGDGTPIREYTYSKDLALAIDWCLDFQERDTLLNIGNTDKITVKELALKILRMFDIDEARLKFNFEKDKGKQMQSTDNGSFLSLSHFSYSPIELALTEAIEYFRANADRGFQ